MTETSQKKTPTGLEIAVIGMAGRFPGARNIDELWENLKKAIESITFFTNDELSESGVDSELLNNPNYIKAVGILPDGIDGFDSSFFGYIPSEAEVMDPQVRLFHECTWEALEDAGYATDTYTGRIGVYAGAANNPVWEAGVVLSGKHKLVGEYVSRCLSNKEFLCNWISYKFNLKGPAVEVHTACSTSLVAIHIACRALLTKECDLALAGGVHLSSAPNLGYLYQEGVIMSSDGHCRAFDSRAGGVVNGFGAGVVVLKKLKEAVQQGDHIYAVIKASAINNDGCNKVGFTAPGIEGQAEVIKTALHLSKVEAESIGYIENHGTGTIIGDPIEMEALKLAFNTEKRGYCAIGSIKTNIGHLDTAAGVTGLIKAVLALKYKCIPPSLHFETPNSKIDFKNSPFYVNTQLVEWKNNGYPLRAGVSSFGIGGTNAHVVLEEWDEESPTTVSLEQGKQYQALMLLSAKVPEALEQYTQNLSEYFKANGEINIGDVAYTLSTGRNTFEYRKTLVVEGVDDAIKALDTSNAEKVQLFHTKETKRPVVFMFPGQGAQYVNMGLGLYRNEPIFRREMDRCFDILKTQMGYDLKEILYPGASLSRVSEVSKPFVKDNNLTAPCPQSAKIPEEINQTEITQPVIFAVEYSMAKLLNSWGIIPYAMTGHSIGEYTAACLAGVFSLEDALGITAMRGKLMQRMPAGGMLSVTLPEEQLNPLLTPEISLAAANSSSHCVVSGTNDAIDRFMSILQEKGISCRRLHTSHAFHSFMMEPILSQFEEGVAKVQRHIPEVPFISGLKGEWITAENAVDPQYWARHLREAVRFRDGLSQLLEKKNALFIEVGPGNVLSTFLRQHKEKTDQHFVVNLLRHPGENKPDENYLLSKIGQLWLCGVHIDWVKFYSHEKRNRLSLPTYPFDRQAFSFNAEAVLKKLLQGERISAEPCSHTGMEIKQPEEITGEEISHFHPRPGLTVPYVQPGNEIERNIASVWSHFFGFQSIGIDDDFFELGGDSLKASTIIALLHRQLNVKIPLEKIFKLPTVRGLAEYINEAVKINFKEIKSIEKKEYYPLSSNQKRLYIVHWFNSTSTAYNMPFMLQLEQEINREDLENSFRQLITRHESLRTSFVKVKDQPVQRVHDAVDFEIEYNDISDFNIDLKEEPELSVGTVDSTITASMIELFLSPFNLAKAPLFKVGLVKLKDKRYLLMVDIHHIITDGISQNILANDFMSLFLGNFPPVLKIQYKEYAEWQHKKETQEILKRQEKFWLTQFQTPVTALEIPADFPRKAQQSFEGAYIEFELQKEEYRQLIELAHSQGVTLFMLTFALFNIFLAKITGQEDIVVGIPVFGRRHDDLKNIVGMFVNTLALRSFPIGEKDACGFIKEIKENTINAFENQDYYFEDLVEKTGIQRDMSRNPLFDVRFTLRNFVDIVTPSEAMTQADTLLQTKSHHFENRTSKFDFSFDGLEIEGTLKFIINYCTKLFREPTINRYLGFFHSILKSITGNPKQKISELEIIDEGEKQRILRTFNCGPQTGSIQLAAYRVVEEHVKKTPDRIAMVSKKDHLTYNELNERSGALSNQLTHKGIHVNDIVVVIGRPSVEMIQIMLGIFKTGAAFCPVDPEIPGELLTAILTDCAARWVVNVAEGLSTGSWQWETNEFADSKIPQGFPSFASNSSGTPGTPGTICSVLYSNTPGKKPEAIVNMHWVSTNRLNRMQKSIPCSPEDTVFHTIPFTEHPFAIDMVMWSLQGGKLYINGDSKPNTPETIIPIIAKHRVSVLHMYPSLLRAFLSESTYNRQLLAGVNLNAVVVFGESLTRAQLTRYFNRLNSFSTTELIYLYSPGETFSPVSYLIRTSAKEELGGTTGIQSDSCSIYILDPFMKVQPVGIPGDLYLGGENVPAGYLNRPDLTREKVFPVELEGKQIHLYKSGDYAKWSEDGQIHFISPVNRQVKIKGYRIDIEIIERNLMELDSIDEAVVLPREENNNWYLIAFTVSTQPIKSVELKALLSKSLPRYMIPSFFVSIDQLPLTSDGKLYRKVLESYNIQLETGVEYVPPRNEIERTIAEFWKEILSLEKVGIYENFFNVGGTSLDIIKLHPLVKNAFDEEDTVVQMFRYPTIHSFAEYLNRKKTGTLSDEDINRSVHIDKMKTQRQKQKNKRQRGGSLND